MIWVTARFRSVHADALVPLLQQLAQHSRTEPGCIRYDYFQSGDQFTSIECWDSVATERAHNQTAFLDRWLEQARPLISGQPEVIRWTKL